MKINYHQQRNKNKRLFSRWVLLFMLFGIFVFSLSKLGVLDKLIRPLYVEISTLTSNATLATENVLNIFTPKSTLIKENQKLRVQLQKLRITELYNKALLSENKDLKEIKKASKNTSYQDGMLARVIDYREIPYGTILVKVDDPSKTIHKGDLALYGNWAIGNVVSLNNNSALIKLFTNSGDAYNVLVGKTEGTLIGTSNGTGKILLSRTEEVKLGAPVSLPKANGLILGYVKKVYKNPEDATETIYVQTPININKLRFITIHHE